MKSSMVLIGLVPLLLSGCAATEQVVPSLAQQRLAQPHATPKPSADRAKTKVARQSQPQVTLPLSTLEPTLPVWTVPSPKPSKVLTSTLSPSQLFEKVSPAVYAVMVLGQPTKPVSSQGSAVAVSPKEAITNCHVVAGAKRVMLANATGSRSAEVISADPSKDRCYLRILDGEFQPVQGFREYATLAVGEVVFTIGSPKGMVNTLSNGLVSGLRKSEDDAEYIQITAPVSEGSSGGGVFDDRGNLIGVTTFTIPNSQNLNFALAASQFWR